MVNLSPVAFSEEAGKSQSMVVENDEHQEPAQAPCVISRPDRLFSKSKTFVRVKTSTTGIYLLKTYGNLADRHQALGAQGKVDTASRFTLNIEVANLSNKAILLYKGKEVARCLPVPPRWFLTTMGEDGLDDVSVVQIYKASKSKQEIMDEHHDTMKQDASFQKKHWKRSVQINEELSNFKPTYSKMMEQLKLV